MTRRPPALAVAVAVLIASACRSSERGAPPAAHDHGGAGDGAAPPAAGSPSDLPGGLDEAAFKALHTLRGDAAPARRGQTIDLGGSRAYLSLPPGKAAPMPAVVVIHEWWGLNDHIEHWADRLAAEGYAALAVDLYGGKVATTPDEAMATMQAVDRQAALATLAAAHRFLLDDPRIKAPRTGAIGWCFGGGYALELAIAEPALDAAVMYYGRPIVEPATLAKMQAELLAVFGTEDTGIPPAKVSEFGVALVKAARRHRIFSYPAPHAFANPSSPAYHEADAARAWSEVRAFLEEKLAP